MRLISTIVWMAAGAASYLFVLNRVLIQMRDRRHKGFLIRAGGLLAVSVSGIIGWLSAQKRWLLLPLAILGLTVAGEVHRLMLRSRHRGEGPVNEAGPELALSRPATTMDLVLRRYQVPVPGWQGPRIRVAHVSDFHLNSHLPLSYFQDAMRRAADTQPDLVVFTGDFITYAEFVHLIPCVLPLARGRFGSFGVIGNHDAWADAGAVRVAAREAGVQMLGNGSVRVRVDDRNTVLLAGYEHPWVDGPWQRPERKDGELAVLLTHTPDNIHHLQGMGFDAVFAGHYHGGQMRLPVLGPLVVPSKYGRRYDRGHFRFGRTHLFVTAGVGSADPPVRIWCPPDILIVDFVGEEGA